MKKSVKALLSILTVLVLFLSGCSSNYVFTGTGTKFTIEVNAPDEAYGESFDFSVGKNKQLVLSSKLETGSLQIDFAEATFIMTDPDSPSNTIVGEVIKSVTVTGNDTVTVELPEYDYVMQCTAIGKTKGVVEAEVVKK